MKRNFIFFVFTFLSGILSGHAQSTPDSSADKFGISNNGKKSATESQVVLSYFNVVTTKEALVLYWQTSSEKNNNYFEIQRSENGFPFKTIALMFAREDAEKGGEYRYIDDAPFIVTSKEVIYRLVQVNMDGKSAFFASEKIKPNNLTPMGIVQIGPNPVHSALQLSLETEFEREINLKIFSLSGQMLYTTKLTINPGYNMFSVYEVTRFVPGNYLVELWDKKKVMNRQTIVKY